MTINILDDEGTPSNWDSICAYCAEKAYNACWHCNSAICETHTDATTEYNYCTKCAEDLKIKEHVLFIREMFK